MTASVQHAAAELLALTCARDSRSCQLLLDKRGLPALLALMPDPPAPPMLHSEQETHLQVEQQQQADLAGNATGRGSAGAAREGLVPPLSLAVDAASNVSAMQSPHQASCMEALLLHEWQSNLCD